MDYNEILLQAIDTLIKANDANKSDNSDKTIICTIVDHSDRENGHYKVEHEGKRFDAYSEEKHYASDEQVYVIIPQNDWAQKKLITSRYIVDNMKPLNYVSPVERIIPFTALSATMNGPAVVPIAQTDESWQISTDISLSNLSEPVTNADSLVIRAKFCTNLSQAYPDIIEGTYGLKVTLTYTQNDGEKQTAIIDFNNKKDMYGDTYGYLFPTLQEQIFSINPNWTITNVACTLYCGTDFKDLYRGEIKFNEFSRFTAENIEVHLGYNISNLKNNTVLVLPRGEATYTIGDYKNRAAQLLWIHKNSDETKLIGFNDITAWDEDKAKASIDSKSNDVYYWIDWYVDDNTGNPKQIRDLMGSEILMHFNCAQTLTETNVYATIYRNGIAYTSDAVMYKNLSFKTNEQSRTLRLENCNDGKDAYLWYGELGMLLDPAESTTIRGVQFVLDNHLKTPLPDNYWENAKITWSVPISAKMIKWMYRADETVENDGIRSYTLTIPLGATLKDISKYNTFLYKIAEQIPAENHDNNIITCTIELSKEQNGAMLVASKSFTFGSSGNSGTNYTIIVSRTDLDNVKGPAILTADNAKASFVGELYNAEMELQNGVVVELSRADGISWGANAPYSALGYNVLKAQAKVPWAGRDLVLSSQVPLIFSQQGDYTAKATNRIIYDSFGTLKSLNLPQLKLFYRGGTDPLKNVVWHLSCYNGPQDPTRRLQLINDTLNPPSLFMTFANGEPEYVLYATINHSVVWSSPILLQQYKYGSSILNNWTGETIVDIENNRILTNVLGAGRMDEYNQFNGVILGEIGKIDDSNKQILDKQTGLIGYGQGAQAFGFLDNGTAFIGKSGSGRIEFDGNKGLIKSPNWSDDGKGNYSIIGKTTGTLMDLDNAELLLHATNWVNKGSTKKEEGDIDYGTPVLPELKPVESHLYFNKNGNGKLEMKLGSLDIHLGDSTGADDTLGGYISATSKTLNTTFADTNMGYPQCEGRLKKVKKSTGTETQTENDSSSEYEYYWQIKFLNNTEIPEELKEGFTFSVTFRHEGKKEEPNNEYLAEYPFQFVNSDREQVFNGRYEHDDTTWKANDSLAFTYKNIINDDTQPAQYQFVKTALIQEYVTSQIKQTADKIESTVAAAETQFVGVCTRNTKNNNRLEFTLQQPENTTKEQFLKEGVTLSLLFKGIGDNGASTAESIFYVVGLSDASDPSGTSNKSDTSDTSDPRDIEMKIPHPELYTQADPFTWEDGDSLQFILSNNKSTDKGADSWMLNLIDSAAYSKIRQTATEITSEVRARATAYNAIEVESFEDKKANSIIKEIDLGDIDSSLLKVPGTTLAVQFVTKKNRVDPYNEIVFQELDEGSKEIAYTEDEQTVTKTVYYVKSPSIDCTHASVYRYYGNSSETPYGVASATWYREDDSVISSSYVRYGGLLSVPEGAKTVSFSSYSLDAEITPELAVYEKTGGQPSQASAVYNLYLSYNNEPVPIYYEGKQLTSKDGFAWQENDTVQFTRVKTTDTDYWLAIDSGAFSKITQTAQEIRSEVSRRGATYYGVSNSAFNESEKVVEISAIDDENKSLTAKDVYATGSTIAITFTQPKTDQLKSYTGYHQVKDNTLQLIANDDSGSSLMTSKIAVTKGNTIKFTAFTEDDVPNIFIYGIDQNSNSTITSDKLTTSSYTIQENETHVQFQSYIKKDSTEELNLTVNEKAQITIKINNIADNNNTYGLYYRGEPVTTTTGFIWDANDIVYVAWDATNTHWNIVDSGAYSKITQTADEIRSEVRSQNATFYCVETASSQGVKTLKITKADEDKREFYNPGTTIAVEFITDKNDSLVTSDSTKLLENKYYNSSGEEQEKSGVRQKYIEYKWEANASAPKFRYKGICDSEIQAPSIIWYKDDGNILDIQFIHETNSINIIAPEGATQAKFLSVSINNEEPLLEVKLQALYNISLKAYGTSKPVYYHGSNLNTLTGFDWKAGDTVFLTWKGEYWIIVDSGAYSQITQTAYEIRSEVANKTAGLETAITQTANEIEMVASRTTSLWCEGKLVDSTTKPYSYKATVKNALPENVDINTILLQGLTIAVKFKDAYNAAEASSQLQLVISESPLTGQSGSLPIYYNGSSVSGTNPFSWKAGDIIYFTYYYDNDTPRWEVGDSGSYASFKVTTDEIRSDVSTLDGRVTSVEQTANEITTTVSNMTPAFYAKEEETKYIDSENGEPQEIISTIQAVKPDVSSTQWDQLYNEGNIIGITFNDFTPLDKEYSYTDTQNKYWVLVKTANGDTRYELESDLGYNAKYTEYIPVQAGDKFTYTGYGTKINESLYIPSITVFHYDVESNSYTRLGSTCYDNLSSSREIIIPKSDPAITHVVFQSVALIDDDNNEPILHVKSPLDAVPWYIQFGDKSYHPVYYKNEQILLPSLLFNSFANDTINFVFTNGTWKLVDSGSYSKITQTADLINAKVSSTGGDPNSFEWSLTADGFTLKSENREEFKCTNEGATFAGTLDVGDFFKVDPKNETVEVGQGGLKYVDANTLWNGDPISVPSQRTGVSEGEYNYIYYTIETNLNELSSPYFKLQFSASKPTDCSDYRLIIYDASTNQHWVKHEGSPVIDSWSEGETWFCKYDQDSGTIYKIDQQSQFTIKGEINATSGMIGNFKVYPKTHHGTEPAEYGLFGAIHPTNHFGVGFDVRPGVLSSSSNIVFGIGDFKTSNLDTSWPSTLNFYVRADGYMQCSYGKIGGWNITSSNITYSTSTDTISLIPNQSVSYTEPSSGNYTGPVVYLQHTIPGSSGNNYYAYLTALGIVYTDARSQEFQGGHMLYWETLFDKIFGYS